MLKAYYVIRKDLSMTKAKFGVQIGHGTQLLMENSDYYQIKEWENYSDSRKIVCEISSEEKLLNLYNSLSEVIPVIVKIVDSGYTEFDGKTLTGIAFFFDDENTDTSKALSKVKRLQIYKEQ